MSLQILDQEYFDEVLTVAAEKGSLSQLHEQLDFLENYGGEGQSICKLGRDFAPYSFSFAMYRRDGRFWFNGGLIYQGDDSLADGGFPSLTVNLHTKTGWFVHT